jgi:hypothetical protein
MTWEELFTEHFKKIDLAKELRSLALDGYETYEDYVKYGEMFVYAERKPVVITPPSHQLKA